jgi:hypothetical protein
MSITPKAIQDLLDELEASKQSRLRAWNVLQRGDEVSLFVRSPISRRDHQGGVQRRLSSCSPSVVEGVGPGVGFDSGLILVTPQIKTEIPSFKLRQLLKEGDAEELSLRVDQNREHLRRWAILLI